MRNGDWIATYTGKKFWPIDPWPEEISIVDIAHALALKCRYNGHCREFYSVGEHCARMSIEDLPGDPRWRLLHDAAEAYLCDVPSPVKPHLVGFKEMENRLLEVIRERFNLPEYPKHDIKYADLVMLATEKRDVMPDGPEWGLSLPKPLDLHISPWPWHEAEKIFLMFAEHMELR